jgi:hypothetical protein
MLKSNRTAHQRRFPTDLRFWSCFLLLNALLFLPLYLLQRDESTFFPLEPAALRSPAAFFTELFIWRDNPDPFRINVEFIVLLALWANVGWLRRGVVRWLMTFTYFVALAYYVYEGIMVYLYRVEPVFYNHYFLIRDGLEFLLEHLNVSSALYLMAAAGAAGLVALVAWTLRMLSDVHLSAELSRGSRATLMAAAVAVLIPVASYRDVLADPRMVVSSLTFKLERNVLASLDLYHNIGNFDDRRVRTTYDYSKVHLARRPNIYLLFVESYGSVLYKRPDYKVAYTTMLETMNNRLTDAGYTVASTLSESPTWGGGSWMAYTSVLFGLRIDAHPQYLALMDRFSAPGTRYPDFGSYLRSEGYYYQWVTSISVELRESMWDKYKQFYGVDRWVRYSDLNYDGARYGWGPAPADQYVVAYARDELAKDVEQPLMMFYITQNSHYPWDPQPEMVDDWHTLDAAPPDGDPLQTEPANHQELRGRYLSAIGYTLDMLTDFIVRHGDEDAIFVLIGDHQPPRVSRRSDGYETPVHIITRDPAFVTGLEQYGFTPGTFVDGDAGPSIRHEGIYSLLMRSLVQTYGEDPAVAPDYLPTGVIAPDWLAVPETPSEKPD